MSLQERVLTSKIKIREKKKLKKLKVKLEDLKHVGGPETKCDYEINFKSKMSDFTHGRKRRGQEEENPTDIAKKKKKKNKQSLEITEQSVITSDRIESSQNSTSSKQNISGNKKKKKKNKSIESSLDLTGTSACTPSEDVAKDEEDSNTKQPLINDISDQLPGSGLALDLLKDAPFSALEGRVCENTLKAIQEMGLTKMTEVQARVIPPLLACRNVVASAKTGSGKTLAFLIPAIELIYKLKFRPRYGVGCIIISPTRELSIQTFGVLKQLMTYHSHTYELLIGGTNRQTEAQKLSEGINIVVSTPGRLLDHLQNTRNFLYKKLLCLVIDEADRIMEIGFEEQMKQIINLLPKKRQTILFSATTTSKTVALTRLAFTTKPVYIGVDDKTELATVEGLVQGYVICPSEKRFLLLFTFLKKNCKKKLMVFFNSCLSVKYHQELLKCIDLNCMCIHGKQKQSKRTNTFIQFCNASEGILLCTDVAARGLDIPDVDYIIQYDPPSDPKEYIHRVGRTARGVGSKGYAILMLRPEELDFLHYLKQARVPLNEYEFSWNKMADIQSQLEELLPKNYLLNQSAKKAFKAYVKAYNTHRLKDIFNVATLDLTQVGKSFGFSVSPVVNLQALGITIPKPCNKSGADSGSTRT